MGRLKHAETVTPQTTWGKETEGPAPPSVLGLLRETWNYGRRRLSIVRTTVLRQEKMRITEYTKTRKTLLYMQCSCSHTVDSSFLLYSHPLSVTFSSNLLLKLNSKFLTQAMVFGRLFHSSAILFSNKCLPNFFLKLNWSSLKSFLRTVIIEE